VYPVFKSVLMAKKPAMFAALLANKGYKTVGQTIYLTKINPKL
jgi:hypothetical protein